MAALLFAAFSMCANVACSDSDDEVTGGKELKLTLHESNKDVNSLTFAITTSNAEKAAYICVEATESVPSAEEVLSNGTAVKVNAAEVVTVDGLESYTEYVVVAAAQGGGKVLSQTINITTAPSSDDKVIYLDLCPLAEYATIKQGTLGDYFVALASHEPVNGLPPVGGMIIYLQMVNEVDPDPMNAILPEGTYTTANEPAVGALVSNASYAQIRFDEGDDGVAMGFLHGSVNVSRDGATYTIDIDVDMPTYEDLAIKAQYTGPLNFVDKTVPEAPVFTEAQDITFTNVEARYFGSWFYPHADDVNVYFSTNTEKLSYRLSLSSLYITLQDYTQPNIRIPEGIYNVSDYIRTSETYIPWEIARGEVVGDNEYGVSRVGSQLTMYDVDTDVTTYGMLTDGFMEVKWDGDNYDITFDFLSEEGVSLKGSYKGAIPVDNRNNTGPNDPNYFLGNPWTTLTADYELKNFASDVTGVAIRYGNYLYPEYGSWCIWVDSASGKQHTDMMIFEVLTALDADMVPEGTYNITYEAGEFVAFPGTYTFGRAMIYSWAGNTTPDSGGYSSVIAPLREGTMTFSHVEGDVYKVVVDAKDERGNRITGEWSGSFLVDDARDDIGL